MYVYQRVRSYLEDNEIEPIRVAERLEMSLAQFSAILDGSSSFDQYRRRSWGGFWNCIIPDYFQSISDTNGDQCTGDYWFGSVFHADWYYIWITAIL